MTYALRMYDTVKKRNEETSESAWVGDEGDDNNAQSNVRKRVYQKYSTAHM